ncbi:MAG: (d)CMP kinase [Gammaproteobacteria bacterium]|nr:(d)CMP kinase [Gammaproteobacteria bacterium]
MSASIDRPESTVPVITIDGTSGSGKGTISQYLAGKLGWHHLDSGALYRLLAYAALQQALPLDDAAALVQLAARLSDSYQLPTLDNTAIMLDGVDVGQALRTEKCAAAASKTAALPVVREALLAWQRRYRKPPGLIADGRDMGTVVFPDATLKLFLTARPEVRAMRRYNQLKNKGIIVDLEELIRDDEARDQRDASRKVSPLMPAGDAVIVDNSDQDEACTLQQVLQAIHGVM